MAHDFNNLLQAITGYTQVLIMDADKNDSGYDLLASILEAANTAAQLVRQLLLFSRAMGNERIPLDLNREVEEVLQILKDRIPPGTHIEFHPGDRLWAVEADPSQLRQIVLNLGTNAAEAMPEGGTVTIKTENISCGGEPADQPFEASGDYLLLTVSDTGKGMNKETIDHIFEPFFTTKEVGQGPGLGLATVYGIVKGHEGHITSQSVVGRGNHFRGLSACGGPSRRRPITGERLIDILGNNLPLPCKAKP